MKMIMETIKKGLIGCFFLLLGIMVCTGEETIDGWTPEELAENYTLNDFPPEKSIPGYVKGLSSNLVNEAVSLSNGVLTVHGESINISEPSHTVVITNGTEYITNVYYAVYDDTLAATLKQYAFKEKIIDITTNEIGQVVTNSSSVAYLDDIPSDSQKADKYIHLWDYLCTSAGEVYSGAILTRVERTEAPFYSWEWADNGRSLELFYADEAWVCRVDNDARTTYRLPSKNQNLRRIDIPKSASSTISFVSTNENGVAYVVYSSSYGTLEEQIEGMNSGYVAKSSLYQLSDKIKEDNLHTIEGIRYTLLGIQEELISIAGGKAITIAFTASLNGKTLRLASLNTQGPITIEWGDGTSSAYTNNVLADISHTYSAEATEIKISGNIQRIAGDSLDAAFCEVLNSGTTINRITIDENVGLTEIGPYAFAGEGSLTSLRFLPKTVGTLGDYCFANSGVQSLEGLPSIRHIPTGCFSGCADLTRLNHMPQKVSTIETYAFAGCNGLESLVGLPVGLISIGEGAFSQCTSLTSLVGLEGTQVTTIADNCFYGCTSLVNIDNIPDEVGRIGSHAFDGCTSLADASELKNVRLTEIGSEAFNGCQQLKTIVLPSSLVSIETNAFRYLCSNPCDVYFSNKECATILSLANFSWGLDKIFENNTSTTRAANTAEIHCLDGDLRWTGSGWILSPKTTSFTFSSINRNQTVSLGSINSQASTRSVSPAEFQEVYVNWGDGIIDTNRVHRYQTDGATQITLLGNVNDISGSGEGASSRAFIMVDDSPPENLTSMNVESAVGLKVLGDNTFFGSSSLTNITFTSTTRAAKRGIAATDINTLGESCFAGCSSLEHVDFLLNTSVESIPDSCFSNCTSLVSIDGVANNDNITSVGEKAFMGCSSLTNVDTLVAKIGTVPASCFRACTNITSLALDADAILSDDAFAECTGIAAASFATRSEYSIGVNALYNIGGAASAKQDEDDLYYQVLLTFANMTCGEVATALGLEDGGQVPATSGIGNTITKIQCSDGILAYNSNVGLNRWEVVVPAISFELADVPSNTTFVVRDNNIANYPGAAYIWNWGDGTVDKWKQGGSLSHTYTTAPTGNYTVTLKGLVRAVVGSDQYGPIFTPEGQTDNPYLVNFKVAEKSPLDYIGAFAFSQCPNLRNIDSVAPRGRGLKKKDSRSATSGRLAGLLELWENAPPSYTNRGVFASSGITYLGGLPTNTVVLGESIFRDNKDLKTMTGMPNSILELGVSSFEGCSSLEDLTSFPAQASFIPERCFAECTGLTNIEAISASNVDTIGPYAFYKCDGLESLEGLSDSTALLAIRSGAFQNSGLKTLEGMPSTVKSIDSGAFAYCDNLESMGGFSQSVTNISSLSFIECTSLNEITNIPAIVTKLNDYCFLGCESVTNVVIGKNIQSLGASTLVRCGSAIEPTEDVDGNLVSCTIVFPERTCAEIRELWGTNNFATTLGTTKLVGWNGYIIFDGEEWVDKIDTIEFTIDTSADNTTIALGSIMARPSFDVSVRWGDGSAVETINWFNATTDGDRLLTNTVAVAANESVWTHNYAAQGTYTISIVGRVQRLESISALSDSLYRPFLYATNNTITVQDFVVGNNVGLSELGRCCFYGYSEMPALYNMEDTKIVSIGDYCFAHCSSLESLDGIPSRLQTIGNHAFEGCTSLGNIEALGDANLISIGVSAFENCSSLTSIVGMGNDIATINTNSFKNCTSLTSLNGISTDARIICEGAFNNCTALANISALGQTKVTTIEDDAFGAASITSLQGLPFTLEKIGERAFANSKLELLTGMPSTVEEIGKQCFYNCNRLRSISAISANAIVGEECFKGCTELESGLGFPSVNTSIAKGMFENCSALSDITWLPSSIALIDTNAFKNSGLKEVILPTTVTALESEAFACSYITNMIFEVAPATFASTALSGIGSNVPSWLDEDECLIKTVVRFPNLTIDEISNLANFPWGAPTATTKFVGSDGFLVWDGSSWGKYRLAITMTIVPEANIEYTIGGMTLAGGSGSTIIAWGDRAGNAAKINSNASTNHTYKSAAQREVRVFGNIQSLMGAASGAFFRAASGSYPDTIRGVIISTECPLQTIGNYAFNRCASLANVECRAATLESIGNAAFFNCTNLVSPIFAAQNLQSLGNSAFLNTGITSLEWLPTSVTSLGVSCFRNCEHLTSLEFDISGCTLGSYVFANCTSLGSDGNGIDWPETIEIVPEGTFSNCVQLTQFSIGESCTNVKARCLVDIGKNATATLDEFGNAYKAYVYAMSKTCEELWGRTLPSSLAPQGAFEGVYATKGDKNIKFICSDGYIRWNGSNWEKVGYNITLQVEVSAGETVSIGATYPKSSSYPTNIWAFVDGGVATQVAGYNTNDVSYTFNTSGAATIGLITAAEKMQAKTTSPWVRFSGNGYLKKVTIAPGARLTSIGSYVLANFPHLTTVSIQCPTLNSFGSHTFTDSTNLVVESGWFNGCGNLTTLGAQVFKNDAKVTVVDLRKTKVSSYGSRPFLYCRNLGDIYPKYETIGLAASTLGSEIGVNRAFRTYKYGNFRYQTAFHLEKTYAKDILAETNFPFGADTNFIFIAKDGFVGYDSASQQWKPYEYGIILEVDLSKGNTIAFNEITPKSGKTFLVDWDDGTIEANLTQAPGFHKYTATSGTKRIMILGEIERISGLAQPSSYSQTLAYNYNIYDRSWIKYGKNSITSIYFGNQLQVTDIGRWTFEKMENLQRVYGDGMKATALPDYCFEGCTNLTEALVTTATQGITSIGKLAYANCTKLAELNNSLTQCSSYGESAFENCIALENIDCASNAAVFSNACFKGCIGITNIVSLNSASILGNKCFQGCTSLTSVQGYPSNGNRIVPEWCFDGCTNLTSLAGLPNSITNIEDYAFARCPNIHTLEGLPSDLRRLGRDIIGPLDHNSGKTITDTKVMLPSGIEYFSRYGVFGGWYDRVTVSNVVFGLNCTTTPYAEIATFLGSGIFYLNVDSEPFMANGITNSIVFRSGLSKLVMRDGVLNPWLINAHDEWKYKFTSAGMKITLANIAANTTIHVGTITPHDGEGLFWDWGDGNFEYGLTNAPSSHTYTSAGTYVIRIGGRIKSISTGATYPFIRTSKTSDNTVSEIVIYNPADIESISGRVFANMTKCRTVEFKWGGSGGLPTISSNAFMNIGSSLPDITTAGVAHKTNLIIESLDAEQIMEQDFMSDLNTATLINTQDGYVYYDTATSQWKGLTTGMTIQGKWTERYNDKVVTCYYIQNGVKYLTNWTTHNNTGKYLIEEDNWKTYPTYVGPFTFKNNGHGFIKVDNEPTKKIASGEKVSVYTGVEGENVAHTITIMGRIERVGIEERAYGKLKQSKLVSQPNGNRTPVQLTSVKFGPACELKYLASFADVQHSPATANIPSTVEEFGYMCFSGNQNIENLRWLPASTRKLGEGCFSDCTNLKNLYGIGGATNLTEIGALCFANCTSLKSSYQDVSSLLNKASFPESLTTIGNGAFLNVGQGGTATFALLFKGKFLNDIQAMSGFGWDNRVSTYKVGSGNTDSRIRYYGQSGTSYVVDVSSPTAGGKYESTYTIRQ